MHKYRKFTKVAITIPSSFKIDTSIFRKSIWKYTSEFECKYIK